MQLLFINLESNDINNLILDFNLQLDYFLYVNMQAYKMPKHNKEFQDSLNEFKISLTKRYKNYPIKFYIMHSL